MIFGTQVPRLRLILLAFVLLAQVYLFVRMRRAILSSSRSDRFKFRAIGLVGAAIGLLFALNAYLMFTYVPWVYPPLAAQIGLFYPIAAWNFGSLFSALLLFLTRVAGRLWRMVGRTAHPPVNPGRRRFLQSGLGGLAAVPILLSGYGAAYASKTYDVEELTLPFGRPLRVVQLSDIHAGIYMNREEMRRYVDQVIALRPDLFVLTGDFISNSMVFLPGCVEEMARVRTR